MKKSENFTASDVEAKLHKTFLLLQKRKKFTLFLQVFFIFAAFLVSVILLEQWLFLSPAAKSLLIFSGCLSAATIFILGLKNHHNSDFPAFYRKFSRSSHFPELKDILDLEHAGRGNKELIDAAILQNLSRVKPELFEEALKTHRKESAVNKVFKRSSLLTAFASLIFIFTAFNLQDAASRTFRFWQHFEKPNPYTYSIEPGNVTLEQGSDFKAFVVFQGAEIPDEISLMVKTPVEEKFRTIAMKATGTGFESIPFSLNNDLIYYVEMDGYKSETYAAEVQLRPRFSEFKANVHPPAYTVMDSAFYAYPFSQIRAYEGSEIHFRGLVNKEIQHLILKSIKSEDTIHVDNDLTFYTTIQVTNPDTLSFAMSDENGLTNKNPFQIIIDPQKDEYPVVEILEPGESLEKVKPVDLNIAFRATDDFGLSSARFVYELQRAFVDEVQKQTIRLKNPRNGVIQSFNWKLDSLNLKPQDKVTFWIEVQDNDGYSGYKTAASARLTLTVPSLVDYFEDLDEKEDEVEHDLDDITDSFRQMQDQYEQFNEMMKDNPDNAGFEESQQLEQARKLQEEVQKKIQDLNKKFEEIKKEISESGMLSEETRKAYEELTKLMEEIDDPEFLKAMQNLREQLGQLNPEQLREAMENLEFNEELYRQRLERTIELFKQLKLTSDLEKLLKSYEDMARREQELNEPSVDKNQIKAQREQMIEENEKLKNKVDSLSGNTTKRTEKSIQEYQQKAKEELDEISGEMKKKMNNGNNSSEESESQQHKSKIVEQYQQLSEETKSLMEGMNQKQAQINIAGLQYILQSLLSLSDEQENLSTQTSSTESRSQAYISYARTQQNIGEIFTSISDSLFTLSKEIPQFSNEINTKKQEVETQLENALLQMVERSQSQSSVAARQALGGINEISFMIANLLSQLQNAQNSGGGSSGSVEQMIEQLQQSGEQQRQLNQQIQEMINDLQGERLSVDQMERMNEIAKMQNRIRKQIEKLQQEGQAGDKIGSELERMIEEMEETINDLRGGTADPTLIERQQNILSRMLESDKALQERNEEEKREGKTADEILRTTPPELTLEELEKQIRKRLNNPDFTKYSDDYQRLIEKYFELLQELQERES